IRAMVARLCASQESPSVSGSVCVMMKQLRFEANKVGAEAVAHDRMRGFQFEAGDQRGFDGDLKQDRVSEDTGERFAAGLHLLRGYRTGGRQTDRRTIRADRCSGSLR